MKNRDLSSQWKEQAQKSRGFFGACKSLFDYPTAGGGKNSTEIGRDFLFFREGVTYYRGEREKPGLPTRDQADMDVELFSLLQKKKGMT